MATKVRTRPEESGPADIFYNETEANKYLHSSRMIEVQTSMAERAVEMLCLPEDTPCLLLDVGCGTGLSGEVLEEEGHTWMGCDISRDMLGVAQQREVEGELIHSDMGTGLPFRQGAFDGAISISAIQWLCYSNDEGNPRLRLAIAPSPSPLAGSRPPISIFNAPAGVAPPRPGPPALRKTRRGLHAPKPSRNCSG